MFGVQKDSHLTLKDKTIFIGQEIPQYASYSDTSSCTVALKKINKQIK